MNLTEEKKMPLRMQPTENKKKMLINHYKGVTQVIKNYYIYYCLGSYCLLNDVYNFFLLYRKVEIVLTNQLTI